jgi:predicted ester cyclase
VDRSEELKSAVRRHLTEAISQQRTELWDDLLDPQLTVHHRNMTSVGRDAYLDGVALWRAAFPDRTVEIEDPLCDGDKVIARYLERGTHQGQFRGAPPSGLAYQKRGIGISRMADGPIAELWCQEDELGLRHQLGLG